MLIPSTSSSSGMSSEIMSIRQMQETVVAPQGDTSQIVKDVVVIFLAGIAIVVGLLLLTYLIMIVMDQYCCCFPGFRRPGEQQASGIDRGPVARKAGLWGLRQDERRLLLERILVGKPYRTAATNMLPTTLQQQEEDEENPPTIQEKETEETMIEVKITNDDCPPNRDDGDNEEDKNQGERSDRLSSTEQYLDEANHDVTCAICLSEYVEGEMVVTGTSCDHLFHKSCAFHWLAKQDHCPYCRKEMMTAVEMRNAAREVLGHDRVLEMAMWGPTQELMQNNFDETTTNDNDDDDDGPPSPPLVVAESTASSSSVHPTNTARSNNDVMMELSASEQVDVQTA